MSAQIKIEGLDNLNKQLDIIRKNHAEKAFKFIVTLCADIKYLAQQRLKDRKHIVTSRLRGSIYVKTLNQKGTESLQDNGLSYSDLNGKLWSRELQTVTVKENEAAVGTGVEYAEKIELMDSYLYWGAKNVDITKNVDKVYKELEK